MTRMFQVWASPENDDSSWQLSVGRPKGLQGYPKGSPGHSIWWMVDQASVVVHSFWWMPFSEFAAVHSILYTWFVGCLASPLVCDG